MNKPQDEPPEKKPASRSPGELVACFSSSDPYANLQAAEALIGLLTSDDRLTRWGAVYFLLHSPFNLYLPDLLKAMQVSTQPEEIQSSARSLSGSRWLKNDYTPSSLTLVHAKAHKLFFLSAKLFSSAVQPNDRTI